MSGISILSTARYNPKVILTNQMFEQYLDTSDEWIQSRTGICTRYVAGEGETSLSMSLAAAKQAIERSGIDKSDIAVVVVGSVTGDYLTPSQACLLQRELELPEEIFAIDINAACNGFLFAMKTAHSLLEGKEGKYALAIGTEMLSRMTNYDDRSTCVLFGDGSGAVIFKRDENSEFFFDSGARGNDEALVCPAQYIANSPFTDLSSHRMPGVLKMNGSEVFRFAVESAAASISRVLAKAATSVESINHFVLHQANGRIIKGLLKKLGIPKEKAIVVIDHTGNTSAASVGIALDELNQAGKLKRGDRVVLSSFGGGLTYGSAYLTW